MESRAESEVGTARTALTAPCRSRSDPGGENRKEQKKIEGRVSLTESTSSTSILTRKINFQADAVKDVSGKQTHRFLPSGAGCKCHPSARLTNRDGRHAATETASGAPFAGGKGLGRAVRSSGIHAQDCGN